MEHHLKTDHWCDGFALWNCWLIQGKQWEVCLHGQMVKLLLWCFIPLADAYSVSVSRWLSVCYC